MRRPVPARPSSLGSFCSLRSTGWAADLVGSAAASGGGAGVNYLDLRTPRACGWEWTDDGEVHETRAPKGGPRNAVRRVPIPPRLVQLLREHVDQYGTGPAGELFLTYRGGTYQPSTLWQVLRKARVKAFTPAQVTSPLARRPTRQSSFRIYSVTGDIGWHFAAYGCTAVQPRVRVFVQLRSYFAWW